jgi:hypothetical protein
MTSPLLLFVYGTLKRGYWNHPAHCSAATAIGPGSLPGTLWLRQSGTPILDLEEHPILAKGTADLAADIALQARHLPAAEKELLAQLKTKSQLLPNQVVGEWVFFEDGLEPLRKLDFLEEFTPNDPPASLYDRFLIQSPGIPFPIWVYGIPSAQQHANLHPELYRPARNPLCWNPLTERELFSE